MKKLIKIIEWGVFVVLFCLLLFAASPYLPTKQYLSSYAIVSGSMEPTVPIGAITFVKQVDAGVLQKGDIIAFTDPSDPKKIILHRIYEIKQKAPPTSRIFITKGDFNPAPDAWQVTPNLLKGKFFYALPYVGYVTTWLKTPIGFGIVIGIPALVLVIINVLKIKDGIKEEIEKGVAKKEKLRSIPTEKLTVLLLPFLFTTLALTIIPPIHGMLYGSVSISGISISFNKKFKPTPTPTICPPDIYVRTDNKHRIPKCDDNTTPNANILTEATPTVTSSSSASESSSISN